MKKGLHHVSTWAFILLSLLAVTAQAKRPPNIIFILADDLGCSELGCYGNKFHETPHLDKLASQGMNFSQAYAAAPVCSPYRAALLTGQHPARIGILDYLRPNSANPLSPALETLPEVLQENGYKTGMVGKWHLTGYAHHGAEFELRPTDHGFAWNIGSEVKSVGNGANFWPYVFRDQPIPWIDLPNNRLGKDEYLTDRLNLEAVEFIERNREQPFFLYLSHYAPHTILNGRPDLVAKYRAKHPPGKSGRPHCYICEDVGLGKGDPGNHWATSHNPHLAAMLESIDHGVGLISAKLDELGLSEDTIFIFTSDNGGESNVTTNAPYRGGKSELHEGGIRVPLIVRWPKNIPAKTINDQATQNVDFYPTLLAASEIKSDSSQALDGVSMIEAWKDPAKSVEREFLAWHYPLDKPHFLGGFSGGAIRSDNWKLIEHFDTGKLELYSLANDPGETTNLAKKEPAQTTRLRNQLAKWRRSVSARTPSPPLLTTARQLYFAEHFTQDCLSERLWYNADWKAKEGILNRLKNGSENTRIFLSDTEYKDCVIRFDFRLGDARDVRLMTGGGGGYNTVLHLRPDHFFLQTAKDATVPYFSYRHSECAYDFEPDRWYTMTVEFLGDEVIAHLDHEHLVHAKHPIIDRTRDYFALQVDEHAAEFDNIQILTATEMKSEEGRALVKSASGKHPVEKTTEEQYKIRKTNAHEWYYQNDGNYRALVLKVDELDQKRKQEFPDAFRSHKEFKKALQNERKRLNKSDTDYREALHATHRANRAIDEWLITQKPELEKLPNNRKKAAIQQLHRKLADSPELQELVKKAAETQAKFESAYPDLFISDDEIRAKIKASSAKSKDDPKFKQLSSTRAAAYRAQNEYLLKVDDLLRQLDRLLNETK